MHSTGALFLIDDSSENALDASTAIPPCKVLLFGRYPWNAVVHDPEQSIPEDSLPYYEKAEQGLLEESERRRQKLIQQGWLPHGVERVSDWEEVVQWVKEYEKVV